MKLKNYILDKIHSIIIFAIYIFILSLLFFSFEVDSSLSIAIYILSFAGFTSSLLIDFFRKRTFYNELQKNIEELDKAYLVIATLDNPTFLEGRLATEAIYDIGKSMNENIKKIKNSQSDFKDYLEMWIHEVKIPLSTLQLMIHNHKKMSEPSVQEQLRRIESYVEQILYYVRQETSEKDYLIKEVSLAKVLNNIALKNKDALLAKNISFQVDRLKSTVKTDSKWLEFILNQIVDNAIKYTDPKKDSFIEVEEKRNKDTIELSITDNGIGIPKEDLSRIFDKSFTGQNGRGMAKSTGMGLYIVKNLIDKLGHKIEITSKFGEFTKVTIYFSSNEFYEVVD